MRGAMDKVKNYTSNKQKLDEFSMVFYNNLLTLGPSLVLMVCFGELRTLPLQPAWQSGGFLGALAVSCLLGFFISFASLWFLSTTTPTIFSLVGSLNKVPLAFIGMVLFHDPTTPSNIAAICIGLVAGVFFARAKSGGGK